MDSTVKDNERAELEPPILQGLAQTVAQVDPPLELRARVLGSARSQAPAVTQSASRPVAWWLATAASLALAAGLTIYTGQLRARIAGLETELRDTRARADAAQQQMVDAQRTASGAQSAVAILTAPDVARVDLAGQQPVSPAASARAFWSRSRGMVFNASNLPPLPAGRTYQLWVVTAQAPISAGLLTPDTQGSVSEIFNTPPDIPQPVAMAVTIEPAGGVSAPTGDKYLIGTL
jgi:Anti-sigma-K factor rskA, C-terminal